MLVCLSPNLHLRPIWCLFDDVFMEVQYAFMTLDTVPRDTLDNIATFFTDEPSRRTPKICPLRNSVNSDKPHMYQNRMMTTKKLILYINVIDYLSYVTHRSLWRTFRFHQADVCHDYAFFFTEVSIFLQNPFIYVALINK